MAVDANRQRICLMYSNTSGAAPTAADMSTAEVFMNTSDRHLGFKAADGTIKYLIDKNNSVSAMSNVVHKSGTETITGSKTFTGSCTFSQTIKGTAQYALWADLAECYQADSSYEPGTLIKFGGKKEITLASDGKVNGVVSEKPGLLLNSEDLEVKNACKIAMIGRVRVKVKGRVEKFDKIVLSKNYPGVGVVNNWAFGDQVIAVALRSKHTKGIGKVLCTVMFKLA